MYRGLALTMAALIATACSPSDPPQRKLRRRLHLAPHAENDINPRLMRKFRPVDTEPPPPRRGTPEMIVLGRQLFFEPRLSRNHEISCNSCHPLDRYGTDGEPTSLGVTGKRGGRNAPSVYNAAYHFAQFWDGRSPTVEDQATKPILNEIEMGMTDDAQVVSTLRAIPQYVEGFAAAFPGDPAPITMAHLGDAIGAFERGLVTRSRWDDFLADKADALTTLERRGLRLFLDAGCMVCHTGPQVGGTMFERVGAVEPWPNERDLGRAGVTHLEADRMVFKVPSLKNIEKTAPYFHDGSAATLETAIQMMGRHQLGIELENDEIAAIAAWMRAMTGPLDREYIAAPTMRDAPPADHAAARRGR
jgi:cytochrome c peroxidase